MATYDPAAEGERAARAEVAADRRLRLIEAAHKARLYAARGWHPTGKTRLEAPAALAVALDEIDLLMEELQARREAAFGFREPIHWAHVGSVAHIADRLREVLGFLGEGAR